MKNFFFFILLITNCIIPTTTFAFIEDCPGSTSTVHCAYINQTNDHHGKWIKAVMSPRNLVMVLCMNEHTTLTLEKDDLKEDQVKPGTSLTWQINQCTDESCVQSQPLATDQFTVYADAKQGGYYAEPAAFGFALLANYGESCEVNK